MVRIGTAGWSIPRTAAESFPGAGSHLERYGRVLHCAEINSSFYRPPMPSTWAKWASQVPDGFEFSVKAPKTITHEAGLAIEPEALETFLGGARRLQEKLGPLLFQLPPKLAFERHTAESFLAILREHFEGRVVLEPRHGSWFTPAVSKLLERHRVSRVAADPARVPEAAELGGWRGLRYWRLHGSPRMYYSAYTAEFLDRLAKDIAAHESEAWVIFDNTAAGAAIGNALELQERLQLAER